jgi:phosphopentomutase
VPPPFTRAIVIVLDGVGVGELPDAAGYGDAGSNTLGHVASHVALRLPALNALGLGRLVSLGASEPAGAADGAVGRMREASPGKDSVTGHWELMGVVLERPFPVFPQGFPADVIAELSRLAGRDVIGNTVSSGTRIIDELGPAHLRSGALIVYTSADSVFQIAAHEDVVALHELYRVCECAFTLVCKGLGVGRVIARPFVGAPGRFQRTANRRDYVLPPPRTTLLDLVKAASLPVVAIGKVDDLFAGRGITRALHTASDDDGMDRTVEEVERGTRGLVVSNLVDFDTKFGHRNDVEGFGANLERFDAKLVALLSRLKNTDLLVITADHGNDPTTGGTDHSREHVPLLVTGAHVKRGVDLGTRNTFADLGQTLAEVFSLDRLAHGTSFLSEIAA